MIGQLSSIQRSAVISKSEHHYIKPHLQGVDMTNSSQNLAQALHELEQLKEELHANWKNERLRIEESLYYLITHSIGDDYNHIKNSIEAQVKTGETCKNQNTSQWTKSELDSQTHPERENTLIALTYLLLFDFECQNGSIASASKLICHASHFEGYASGLTLPRINRGGRGRSESSKNNKDKIAALISSHRPEGGWKKERDAANWLYDEAVKLNKNSSMNLTPSNLTNLMTDWMKEDGSACRAAFLGTSE